MPEQSRKWTVGKWAVTEDDGQLVVMRDNYYVATCHAFAFDPGASLTGDADLAAAFIVDAFKVENETGLTPRQLAERVEQLRAMLFRIVKADRNAALMAHAVVPTGLIEDATDLYEATALRTEPRT